MITEIASRVIALLPIAVALAALVPKWQTPPTEMQPHPWSGIFWANFAIPFFGAILAFFVEAWVGNYDTNAWALIYLARYIAWSFGICWLLGLLRIAARLGSSMKQGAKTEP